MAVVNIDKNMVKNRKKQMAGLINLGGLEFNY